MKANVLLNRNKGGYVRDRGGSEARRQGLFADRDLSDGDDGCEVAFRPGPS